jgi:hypothetical protein
VSTRSHIDSLCPVIVWLNGTHGAGKTTTSALVQQLIPDSLVLDAEKVGETLMDITPGLPRTDNFQHWPPWRPLVVDTADQDTLRRRIEGDTLLGASAFRLAHLESYAEAAQTWLHDEAEVIDTTHLTPGRAARQVADAVRT